VVTRPWPHWIEHNAEHAAEFRQWAERAGEAGEDIRAAMEGIEDADGINRLGNASYKARRYSGRRTASP